MIIITKTAEETQKLGEEFADKVKNGGLICLYGNLGAGKTTFTQGLAKGLAVKQNVVSPTFVLIRRYELVTRYLWHIDLYRLETLEEIKGLGIEEIMGDPKNIVLIEWPEKIKPFIPSPRWEIKLESISENEREIEINQIK